MILSDLVTYKSNLILLRSDSCVLFLTQPTCIVQKQITSDFYHKQMKDCVETCNTLWMRNSFLDPDYCLRNSQHVCYYAHSPSHAPGSFACSNMIAWRVKG